MARDFNFSAGPAALPEPVLRRAQAELLEFRDEGASVMEISHRGKAFIDVAETAERNLRALLSIPDDYAVLFLQGGATGQQALLPLNLAGPGEAVDYVVTGHWGAKAVKEAEPYADLKVVASSKAEDGTYTDIVPVEEWQLRNGTAYVHYTPNETIHGVEYLDQPHIPGAVLVGDMSSTILSRPIDVSKFGVIYAGAQKNIGPSGIVVVIVRRDLLERTGQTRPPIFNWKKHAENDSMLNTPPTLAWYLSGLVFEWALEQGGVAALAKVNEKKAADLYAAIDESGGFYRNTVAKRARSWMNVPFFLHDEALDKPFLAGAEAAGLRALKGHRAVGGMRASIYNAVPAEAVSALVAYLKDFQQRHG
ncbi:MAG: 3-phosphoserine/phosphohydroxythreonine transaminase [Xanthomonadaceae bacterium]|nr:3-phosphoserine/phosphohydroxythreonine transaminase [Xanthomonadaceae bacterium]